MCHSLEDVKLRLGKPIRELLRPRDDEREVEVAAYDGHRHTDLLEPGPRREAAFAGLLADLVLQRDCVHREREVSSRTGDAPFGSAWPVKPEPHLDPVDLIDLAGRLRRFPHADES